MDLFKRFLVVQALVTTLNRLPPLRTFMMDLIYPEAVRRNHPFDRLSYSDLQLPTKNIPLVTRGSVSYAVTPDKNKITQIDPQNLTPSITVSAADVNRFNTLSLQGQQTLVDNYIDQLRRLVRKSTDLLSFLNLLFPLSSNRGLFSIISPVLSPLPRFRRCYTCGRICLNQQPRHEWRGMLFR